MKEIITDAAMWLATASTIIVAVITTERIMPMWFFAIPMVVSVYRRKDDDS